MADEVLDSWEDMIEENGVLDKKFNDLKVNDSKQDIPDMSNGRPNAGPIATQISNTSVSCVQSWTNDSGVWPSIGSNNRVNENLNSIKILKRPTNSPISSSRMNDSVNDSNQNQTTGLGPQITLEDNTRTQYVPQVRILKRQERDDKSVSNDRKSLNSSKSQSNSKTYEEREAEYAKARLRILGSASAPEETPVSPLSGTSSSVGTNTSNALSPENRSTKLRSLQNSSTNETPNNVPIIRLPLGPDGTKGFKREPSPQNR